MKKIKTELTTYQTEKKLAKLPAQRSIEGPGVRDHMLHINLLPGTF